MMEFFNLGLGLDLHTIVGIIKLVLSIVVFIGVNQYYSARPRVTKSTPTGFFYREMYFFAVVSKTARMFLYMAAISLALIVALEMAL